MSRRLRAHIFFVTLVGCLVVGSGCSWIERTGAVSLRQETLAWYFQVPLPEDSRWDATTVCSSASLLDPRCDSSAPTIGSCCFACVNGQPAPSQQNELGCLCPPPGAQCLSMNRTESLLKVYGSATPASPARYVVPVFNPTCRPFIVVLNSLSGDPGLQVEVANPAFSQLPSTSLQGTPLGRTSKFIQNQAGDDVILVCQPVASTVDPSLVIDPAAIHVLNQSAPFSLVYISVVSNLISRFELQLQVVQKATDFFIPLQIMNSHVDVSVVCNSSRTSSRIDCSSSGNSRDDSCNSQLQNIFSDPPYALHALAANWTDEEEMTVEEPGLTIYLPVALASERNSTIEIFSGASTIDFCIVSLGGVVDASGAMVNNTRVEFSTKISQVLPEMCQSSEIESLLTTLASSFSALEQEISSLGNDLSSLGLYYGALISNQYWAACNQLVTSFLTPSTEERTSLNTTLCTAPVGSIEWGLDPCCNLSATYHQCCAPRLRLLRTMSDFTKTLDAASGQPKLNSACSSPKCSETVATRLLEARQTKLLSKYTCSDQVTAQTNDPAVFLDVSTFCLDSVDASTFGQNRSAYLLALQDCLIDSMSPNVRAVFLNGGTAADALKPFFKNVCDQGSKKVPDTSLDDESKCLAAFACTSDQDLSEEECTGLSQQFPSMCAQCDETLCREFSDFGGCKVFPPVQTHSECTKLYGTEWRHETCYLTGIGSQAACLAYPYTSTGCASQYTGSTTCPFSCSPQSFLAYNAEQYCGCGRVYSPTRGELYVQLAIPWCEYMVWNTRMSGNPGGTCTLASVQACTSILFKKVDAWLFNRGSQYDPRKFLETEAACLGSEDPSPLVCSMACNNCSDPRCGSCSDLNYNAFCFFPFSSSITGIGVVLGCPVGSVAYPDGCMNPNLKQPDCLAQGGLWRSATTTRERCLGYESCFEPGVFTSDGSVSGVEYSGKNKSECSNCLSQPKPVYTWTQGRLLNRTLFQWKSRTWSNNVFVWRFGFAKQEFDLALAAARSTFLYSAFQSALSCLTGQDQKAISELACDCGSDALGTSSNCYGNSLSFTAISTRLCGLFATLIAVPGRIRIETTSETRFRSGCVGLTVDIVDAQTFARTSASVVSSAFVQSLQLKDLSVVTNKHGVVVGQLASDGYLVQFDSDEGVPEVVAGEMLLCVALRRGSRQSGWKKLSVAYARRKPQADVKSVKFKFMDHVGVIAPETDGEPYCFAAEQTGLYALTWHMSGAATASFFDTLQPDQQAALIIIIVVYLALWMVISVCMSNFVLWWLIQRTKIKLSIDTLKAFINFSLLWLASAIRWVYFLVVIVGSGQDIPQPIEILMVELPLFFFFSVLTVIILKWLEVARGAGVKGKQKPPVLSLSNMTALVLNCLMYGLLILFVILASTGVAEENPGRCSTNHKQQHPALSITYHVIIALICFVLGASFLILGTKVTIQLLRLGGATAQKVRFIQFTSVAGACSIAMILQAILVLVATSVVIPSIVAIIILILVEVLPILLLIWTWNKPIAIKKAISSLASLGSSSNSGTTSSTASSDSGGSTSGGSSSASGAESESRSNLSAGSAGGGLARLWSLGTDSLEVTSLAEEE